MENASKALLMTGSILIGIILLSLAVYMYNIMKEAKSYDATVLSTEQIVKYNMEFLSYDKQVMYGTDVITVLNKAIDSNKKYAEDDESNFIDIAFVLKDDVSTVTTTYDWDPIKKRYKSTIQKNKTTGNSEHSYNFEPGKEYSIEKNLDMITSFFDTKNDTTAIKNPKNPGPEVSYTITYTGFSDFKRMIFKCKEVKKNEVGKVCYMKFEQIKASDYGTDEEKIRNR